MTGCRLEICAETIQACAAARDGGADRIELCSSLIEGGVTPSHGLIKRAMLESELPIYVMLRPRAGNFVYSRSEFEAICSDLEHAAQIGAAGVVCGILRNDNTVDRDRTLQLVKLAGSMEVTFHRAFDETPDLTRALEDLIACGCHRVLTSGGKPSASAGESTLAVLAEQARGRIRVMAGGGITVPIAASLLARMHVDVHTSLRRRLLADAASNSKVLTGTEPTFEEQTSDVRALARLVAKINAEI